jgi:hypothetical protein
MPRKTVEVEVEVVWAKMRGFPWWPATVPLDRDRNRAAEVIFFGTGDHALMGPDSLEPFEPSATSDPRFLPPKKPRLKASFLTAVDDAIALLSPPEPKVKAPKKSVSAKAQSKAKIEDDNPSRTAQRSSSRDRKVTSDANALAAANTSTNAGNENSAAPVALPKTARPKKGPRLENNADKPALRNPHGADIEKHGFAECANLVPAELCARIAREPMTSAEGISNAFQKSLEEPLLSEVQAAIGSSSEVAEAMHAAFGVRRFAVKTVKVLMTEFCASPQIPHADDFCNRGERARGREQSSVPTSRSCHPLPPRTSILPAHIHVSDPGALAGSPSFFPLSPLACTELFGICHLLPGQPRTECVVYNHTADYPTNVLVECEACEHWMALPDRIARRRGHIHEPFTCARAGKVCSDKPPTYDWVYDEVNKTWMKVQKESGAGGVDAVASGGSDREASSSDAATAAGSSAGSGAGSAAGSAKAKEEEEEEEVVPAVAIPASAATDPLWAARVQAERQSSSDEVAAAAATAKAAVAAADADPFAAGVCKAFEDLIHRPRDVIEGTAGLGATTHRPAIGGCCSSQSRRSLTG